MIDFGANDKECCHGRLLASIIKPHCHTLGELPQG
jgi:hypothetical protein